MISNSTRYALNLLTTPILSLMLIATDATTDALTVLMLSLMRTRKIIITTT